MSTSPGPGDVLGLGYIYDETKARAALMSGTIVRCVASPASTHLSGPRSHGEGGALLDRQERPLVFPGAWVVGIDGLHGPAMGDTFTPR
eukprot:scaffold657926_cov36-Prasinocladus_malaysianus.AAC.1